MNYQKNIQVIIQINLETSETPRGPEEDVQVPEKPINANLSDPIS